MKRQNNEKSPEKTRAFCYNMLMGKHIHILVSKNTETKTGVCKFCGPVAIKLKWGGIWRCASSVKDHRGPGGNPENKTGSHGLTVGEARKFKSGKSCAICGSKINLAVDHCHISNVVRGVLCRKCNTGIGLLKEDISILQNAITYISNHQK